MEKENEGCLPFLDPLVKRSPSGHLLSGVYRKPTHLDRYLNFRSEYSIQQKQSVVNTFFERTKKLLHGRGPEQRNEVRETGSHVELLPQMDDSKTTTTKTQRISLLYV